MRDLPRRISRTPVGQPVAPLVAPASGPLALAMAVGNQAFATLARAPGDTKATPGSAEALADGAIASSDVALVPSLNLADVPEAKRLRLIEMCNDHADDPLAPAALEKLWGSFTDLGPVGLRNWDAFARSMDIASDLRDLPGVKAVREAFKNDIRAEALRRLNAGARLVAAEIARVEPMAELGLEQQMNETAPMQAAAYQFQRAQQASLALRQIRVRGEYMGKRPDVTRTTTEWYVEPAYFDPGHRPESTTYDDPDTDPWKGLPTWEEVKSYYDLLIGAMAELVAQQPFLNVSAATDTVHDVAIAPESKDVVDAVLTPLYTDQGAIAIATTVLESGELDPLELGPVVEALRWQSVPAASGTPWAGEFYRWIVSDAVGEYGADQVKHGLLVGAAETALFILASFTGEGLGLLLVGAGIGLGAAQAEKSMVRANDLEALEQAKLKLGDALVTPGEVAAAQAAATVDTIVAFLNLLSLSALGRGAGAALEAEGRGAVAAGDEILSTASRVEAGAARPTAPMAIPEIPPDVPPPPNAGTGAQAGIAQPLNIEETRDLITRALKRPTPLSAATSEVGVDATTFEQAYRNAGGVGALPPAFVDPVSGRIWVLVGNDSSLMVFHEAVHQLSINSGSRGTFLNRFGSYVEEGITETLTREHLGPWAGGVSYDPNVKFVGMIRDRMGVSMTMLERAYLDGELAPLEAAIRSSLNGDAQLSETFLNAVRGIGTNGENGTALRDALHIMYLKAPPP